MRLGKIQILDKTVAELIAAGEVVERPSSIVKELLENSIDAEATDITVEIRSGGVRYIRIADNGTGILREDIPRAFLRHATSKVRSADDLDGILTLGFRGEALASIAAVCRVELTTKTAEEEEGATYRMEGGEFVESAPAGCPTGTTIVIRDIFFNTPARMKFLKKDVAEGNAVALAVEKCALSHPEIAFRFIRDGQVRLRTSGNGDLRSVIYSIYGREFASEMLEVDYTFDGIHVAGYISRPGAVKPTRTYQNYFINGRYVRSRTCSVALEEAFKTKIMSGKFPTCVLGLDLEANGVDVNVHPAKIEVRFVNEKPVFNAVYFAAKSALAGLEQPVVDVDASPAGPATFRPKTVSPLTLHDPAREYTQQTLTTQEFKLLFAEEIEGGAKSFSNPIPLNATKAIGIERRPNIDIYVTEDEEKPAEPPVVEKTEKTSRCEAVPQNNPAIQSTIEPDDAKDMTGLPDAYSEAILVQNLENRVMAEKAEQPAPQIVQVPSYRLIGELFETYILLEVEGAALLVDKHAAHERLKYEQLKENLSYGNRQMLLSPMRITLPQEDYTAVLEHPEQLAAMGFGIEDFNGSLLVREVPIELGEEDIPFVVGEIAGKLRENQQDITPEVLDRLYYSIACKSAIRAGDKNQPEELEALVKKLARNPQITHCPHGRPVSVRLSKYEIEKMFGRLG